MKDGGVVKTDGHPAERVIGTFVRLDDPYNHSKAFVTMTEAEYTDFHNKLCNLYNYVASARCRAWMRPDVRQEILTRVANMRDEFYRIKKNEDAPPAVDG